MQLIGKWWFPEEEQQQRAEVEKTGSWQIDRLLAALDYVEDWTCAFDIGAHVGLWSAEMMKHFDRVVAFEPVPDHFDCLLRNVSPDPKFSAWNIGLSDYDGSAAFRIDDRLGAQNTGGTFLETSIAGDVHVHKLDTMRAAGNIPAPSFMKIDVEGWEVHVLEGAQNLIHECWPIIFVEDKPKFRNRANFHFGPGDWLVNKGYEQIASFGSDKLYRKAHG